MLAKRHSGAIYAVLSGLFFGLIGYFGMSVINAGISISNMLFWRFLVSSLFILLLILPRLDRLKIPFKELCKITFYGAAFYGTCSIIYFMSAQYIGSGLAMVIFFTYPTLVMLINCLFQNLHVSKIYYLALLIIIIGMFCLVKGGKFQFDLLGLALGLVSALLYALYIIMSKNIHSPPLSSTFCISLGSALVCLINALLTQSFCFPQGIEVWLSIAGIGIICTALPIVFLLKGLKYISSLQASILSVLEPVFVVIFGIILLGETIHFTQAVGILILLSGALLTLLSKNS